MPDVTAQELAVSRKVFGEVRERLMARERRQYAGALRTQRQAAAAGGERFTLSEGEFKFQIHPFFFHYWGQRLGYDCWKDKRFVHEFLRDNPECRVKSRSRNSSVLSAWAPTEKRFHKVYAA